MPPKLSNHLTPAQLKAFQLVFEDWELAKLGDQSAHSRLSQLAQLIGPDALKLTQLVKSQSRIEDVERKMGWGPRSAKQALPLLGQFLITIQSGRDLYIR